MLELGIQLPSQNLQPLQLPEPGTAESSQAWKSAKVSWKTIKIKSPRSYSAIQMDSLKDWACNSLTPKPNAVLNSSGNQDIAEKLGLDYSLPPIPNSTSHWNTLL